MPQSICLPFIAAALKCMPSSSRNKSSKDGRTKGHDITLSGTQVMNNEMLEVLFEKQCQCKKLSTCDNFSWIPRNNYSYGICGKAWPWHERIVQLNHHAGLNSSVLTLSKLRHKIRQSGFFSLMPVLFKTACLKGI